jgi:hypothetical protein
MPVLPCSENNKPGFKWGESGNACYTYTPNDKGSRETARKKAIKQGVAITISSGEKFATNDKIVCEKCGWSWKISDGGNDLYICHKCGYDNEVKFATIGSRGGIKKSKKAPKSDTPNKNPQGQGTAKGKASSTRGAVVTKEVEETLRKKVDEFNDRYKEKLKYGVNIGMLKSVYQRGIGAYNVSHSPQVKSAGQWAYARVNAFLYLVKNGRPENKKYTGDYDLLPKEHPKNTSK